MRHYKDWIEEYVKYASHTEAPRVMHYWAAVSAIAAVLGRKVKIQFPSFKWLPNFYVVFVGPPDVVKKTTTAEMVEELLQRVPEFTFGSNVTTWQSLIKELSEAEIPVETSPGLIEECSTLYICSGELGNFLDPTDQGMVDMLVTLWGGGRVKKSTKASGCENIERPLLNMIGCVTPAWINEMVPAYMAEGGLMSRIIFIYGEKREKRIAYPGWDDDESEKVDYEGWKDKLVEDLIDMNAINGEVVFTREARDWGKQWYNELCDQQESGEENDLLQRKQIQVHKLAMVLAAAKGSLYEGFLKITDKILQEAAAKIDELEYHRNMVFRRIGKTKESLKLDMVLGLIQKRKRIRLEDCYRQLYRDIPKFDEFLSYVRSGTKAKLIRVERPSEGECFLLPGDGKR